MRGSPALSLSCSVMALLFINIPRVIVFVDQLEINFRIAIANGHMFLNS